MLDLGEIAKKNHKLPNAIMLDLFFIKIFSIMLKIIINVINGNMQSRAKKFFDSIQSYSTLIFIGYKKINK
ncbi:MAG: hypothetical protein ACD_82C00026G0001 [uncultured bacterium]|nr:MAG: hypothetical protein ACD_82C00026G0001 [uncultured bacterium]